MVTYWRANISDEQERYLHSPISRTTCPKEPKKKKGKQKLAVLNPRGHFSLVSGRGPGAKGNQAQLCVTLSPTGPSPPNRSSSTSRPSVGHWISRRCQKVLCDHFLVLDLWFCWGIIISCLRVLWRWFGLKNNLCLVELSSYKLNMSRSVNVSCLAWSVSSILHKHYKYLVLVPLKSMVNLWQVEIMRTTIFRPSLRHLSLLE